MILLLQYYMYHMLPIQQRIKTIFLWFLVVCTCARHLHVLDLDLSDPIISFQNMPFCLTPMHRKRSARICQRQQHPAMMRQISLLTLLLLLTACIQSIHGLRPSRKWGLGTRIAALSAASVDLHGRNYDVLKTLRAGASDSEDEDSDEEEDDDEDDEEETDSEEEEDSDEEDSEEEESEDEDEVQADEPSVVEESTSVSEYDDMMVPSPSTQLYSVIGVMLMSRRLDMFSPTVVMVGRYVSHLLEVAAVA